MQNFKCVESTIAACLPPALSGKRRCAVWTYTRCLHSRVKHAQRYKHTRGALRCSLAQVCRAELDRLLAKGQERRDWIGRICESASAIIKLAVRCTASYTGRGELSINDSPGACTAEHCRPCQVTSTGKLVRARWNARARVGECAREDQRCTLPHARCGPSEAAAAESPLSGR